VQVENAAAEGAKEILLSRERRRNVEGITRKIKHIKLNEREENFSHVVAEKMYFEDELRR